jgi:threonine/homoserine/homoserine lactone efflux protein
MSLEVVFSFLLASMALTIAPGPDNIFVLTQSVINGKKTGIATSFGLVSGILVHTTLIALGVSALIKQSEIIFTIIKCFGAAYLLWIAYNVYKAPAEINIDGASVDKRSLIGSVKKGFVMNVLNPKVTIFFLAFFPGFVNHKLGNVTQQIYTLGFLFMLQGFVIFSLISIIADKLTVFLRTNKSFGIFLKVLQIVVFTGIAIIIMLP